MGHPVYHDIPRGIDFESSSKKITLYLPRFLTKFPSPSGSLLPVHRILLCLDDHFAIRPISFNLEIRLINARNSQSNELVYRRMDGYFKRELFQSLNFLFFFFVLFLPRTFSFWKKEKIPCADFILTSTWRSRKPTNLQVFESFSLRPFFGSRDQDSVLAIDFVFEVFLFIYLFSSFFKGKQVESTN